MNHYHIHEKINLLEKAAILTESSLRSLANVLDCCTFAELKRISQAIKVMSRGKK